MNQWVEIGREIRVSQETGEDDSAFAQRVLLSAGAAWMQTTLYANNGQVSVERLKRTAQEKMSLWKKTDPCLADVDPEACAEYIYETLLGNGLLLHTPMYGRPAPRKLIGSSPAILRGMRPEEPCVFSGLASFLVTEHGSETIREAFALADYDQERMITLLWKRSISVHDFLPNEILNVHRGGGWNRYEPQKASETDLALARTMHGPNQYDYYLIQGQQIRRISEDMREAQFHDYVRMALLHRAGQQTKVQARCGNHLVSFSIGYLPRPEQRFLRLVCWPESLSDLKQAYRFSIHAALWPMLRERFRDLNYNVEETSR